MKYPILNDRILIRKFEVPLAYNAKKDELYELDDDSFEFLIELDGKKPLEYFLKKYNDEEVNNFLNYCIEEGLVKILKNPCAIEEAGKNNIKYKRNRHNFHLNPSLRHLLIHITFSCNLKCRHCYLTKKQSFMDVKTFRLLLDEFDKVGGLKIMISGGEPLLHPEIDKMLKIARDYDFRKVLITNGTLINESNCNLEVDEVQISIDGIKGHNLLRSKDNAFESSIKAVELLKNVGIEVSVATMISKFNIDEFEEMEKILKSMNLKSWMIDYPSPEGKLLENKDVLVDFNTTGEIMRKYGFMDSGHKSHGDYCCGAHMCSSDPEGNISRCGFFEPVGNIREGIETCWKRLEAYLWRIEDLNGCSDCEYLRVCKGGCRFRAKCFGESIKDRDPVMCSFFRKSF